MTGILAPVGAVWDPVALEPMRYVNFLVSLRLYGMCGIVWLYRGNQRQIKYPNIYIRISHQCITVIDS